MTLRDTVRSHTVQYETEQNEKWQKIRDKVARKKCTKPYVGIRRMFIRFLAIFPVLAGEHAVKHALSLDLTFQCLPNSARITLRFSAGRNTASPWNDFCAPKDSDTAANLTSVILWFVEAKAAKECNPNLVPVNLKSAVTRLPQRPKESTCKWKSLAGELLQQCVMGIDKHSIPDCVSAQVF